jgi:P27 family predicted phage terminase small subunit
MGRRGPPKTPVATLKARGTFRGDRHSDDVESQLEPKIPPPPDHLDDGQKTLWKKLGKLLVARGLVTDLDGMALELLVSSYVGMNRTSNDLAEDDLIYLTDSGSPVMNPLVGLMSKQINLLKWCLREFGCTPSARTGIKVEKPAKKSLDPMAALLANAAAPPPAASKAPPVRTQKCKSQAGAASPRPKGTRSPRARRATASE